MFNSNKRQTYPAVPLPKPEGNLPLGTQLGFGSL